MGKKPTKGAMQAILQEMIDRADMPAGDFFEKYPGYQSGDPHTVLRYFTSKARSILQDSKEK